MNQNVKGRFVIAACAFFRSAAGLFIKITTRHPMVIAGIRSLFMVVLGHIIGQRRQWGKASLPVFLAPPSAMPSL
ncbi:MAG: hypothetical protein LBR99_00665 [Treponema sp.]|nr:hypothetical protein [Treponema sp.]